MSQKSTEEKKEQTNQPTKQHRRRKTHTAPWNSPSERASAPSSPNPLICGGKCSIMSWVRIAGPSKFKPREDERQLPLRRGGPAGLGPRCTGVSVSGLTCGVIPGEPPSGWDVMRELVLRKERSKRKGEEAPSGCNYLPHLNNAFVMIIIERSLTASTWDLTRPSEKQKLQTRGLARLPARPVWRFGRGPDGSVETGTEVSCPAAQRPFWGTVILFPK